MTIADAKGSSPREAGVKMLVTADDTAGTVGGGNLEHEAIRIARTMLDDPPSSPDLRRFALGPSLGQCCGGDTQLLFEPVAPVGETFLEPLRAFARAETPSVLVTPIEGGDERKKPWSPPTASLGAAPPDGLVEAARALLAKPGNAGARLWGGPSQAGGAATGASGRYLIRADARPAGAMSC